MGRVHIIARCTIFIRRVQRLHLMGHPVGTSTDRTVVHVEAQAHHVSKFFCEDADLVAILSFVSYDSITLYPYYCT